MVNKDQYTNNNTVTTMNTVYTLKFDKGYNRLPMCGEVINTNKPLGWTSDMTETKSVVTYTTTHNKGEYLFFTVEVKRTDKDSTYQGKTPYEVVKVINTGYTTVSPGMKSQEVLSQFM